MITADIRYPTMNTTQPPQAHHGKANRLELLLFRLDTSQLFAINVLKVREIINCPALTQMPQSNPIVRGVTELRGHALPVVDMSQAIGRTPVPAERLREHKVIVVECNRTTQGFLVSNVDRIISREWAEVAPPPKGTGKAFITGVIRSNDSLVEVIDIEKVLSMIAPTDFSGLDGQAPDTTLAQFMQGRQLLVVDDSSVARKMTAQTLDQIAIPYLLARDGREALELIDKHATAGEPVRQKFPMIISDIEMPAMDGYQLTRTLRSDPRCAGLYILVHTSLDGRVNLTQAEQAGADRILTKFVPETLAQAVVTGLRQLMG